MEKIKWDGITEIEKIMPALLGFITDEEKQQAKKTAYGYFTDIIRKNHRNSATNNGGYITSGFFDKVTVSVGEIEYFMTWNKAAKYICQWLKDEENLTISNKEENIMENQVITQNQEIIITENYSRAVSLHRRICANALSAQESLFEVCKGLKEMRDGKLYKELGYQNFEDYTQTELGIKRRQAYNYIAVAEKLSVDFVQSTAQIGMSKLALLAELDEPERAEIIQNNDLESTSVKQLQEEIKKLKADTASQIDSMKTRHNQEKADFMREKNELDEQLRSKHKEWLQACNENAALTGQLYHAEEKIKELESNPKQVAVEDTTKIDELEKQNKTLSLKLDEINQDSIRVARQRDEAYDTVHCLEKQIEELENSSDNSAKFNVYHQNCINAVNQLFDFLTNTDDSEKFMEKIYELSDYINSKIENID